MFQITREDVAAILRDYNIAAEILDISELQRYHYERDDPETKEVRLIIKVEVAGGSPLVVRFKNESGVTLELIESQCRFAGTLKQNGIITPAQYMSGGRYARWYTIGGYEVIVTLEQFAEGEIKVVDEDLARKTGELLARTHTIAEEKDLHVDNDVLFDPFARNDLFFVDKFLSLEGSLQGESRALFDRITGQYNAYMAVLAPLKKYPRYAVQGDISDCNLYQTPQGELGIFDFNRSGDNILFCDAVMQAVFEARLMDYPENSGDDYPAKILASFLEGYCSVRSFSPEERAWFACLYPIIDAFWGMDICWREDSLLNAHRAGDAAGVQRWLEIIWKRLAGLAEPGKVWEEQCTEN